MLTFVTMYCSDQSLPPAKGYLYKLTLNMNTDLYLVQLCGVFIFTIIIVYADLVPLYKNNKDPKFVPILYSNLTDFITDPNRVIECT